MARRRGTPTIAAEIRQVRPFRTPGAELVVSLLRTADVVRTRIAAALEPAGLTPSQYNVLRILRGAGGEGLATLAIAERMIQREPGITRLLDRLERKGLVERRRGGRDRRQVLCRITRAGLALLARLDRAVDAADAAVAAPLAAGERRALLDALDRIRHPGGGIQSDNPAIPTRRTR